LTIEVELKDLEFPQYLAYRPSKSGYDLTTPFGPSTIELGDHI